MGTWSASITGNDTAQDLKQEYTVAFWKFEVPEALRRLDAFVRQDFDESDEEEWADYYYSLADFMWRKGILTDQVRDRAIAMIDSGFGLELWAEAGKKRCRSGRRSWPPFGRSCSLPCPPGRRSAQISTPSGSFPTATSWLSSCRPPGSPTRGEETEP